MLGVRSLYIMENNLKITQITKELLRDNTTITRKQVKTNGKINELRGGRGPEKKFNPFPILSLTSAKE